VTVPDDMTMIFNFFCSLRDGATAFFNFFFDFRDSVWRVGRPLPDGRSGQQQLGCGFEIIASFKIAFGEAVV
jgi:hypothetical protein